MTNLTTTPGMNPLRTGVAADHGGFDLKQYLEGRLREAGCAGNDFCDHRSHQDDNLNVICLGGRMPGQAFVWERVRTFLPASNPGPARHRRRLAKVGEREITLSKDAS